MFKKLLFVTLLGIIGMNAKAQYLIYVPSKLIPAEIPPPISYTPDPLLLKMEALIEKRLNDMLNDQQAKTAAANDAATPTVAILSEFIIRSAKISGIDVSQHYINARSGIAIYSVSNRPTPFMAIVMPGDNSKSYGEMLAVSIRETPQTPTSFGKTTTEFSWIYVNSYDNKQGTATVTLVKEYRQDGTVFTCHITVDAEHYLDFEGITTQ